MSRSSLTYIGNRSKAVAVGALRLMVDRECQMTVVRKARPWKTWLGLADIRGGILGFFRGSDL